MSREELVERFSLERVGASPATFDYAKLDWMNGVYLRALSPDEYADALITYLREQGYDWDEERIRAAGAARAGEDREARRVPRVRGLPLRRRRARSGPARPRRPDCGRSEALESVEPFTAAELETALKELCGAPRPEAAAGVPADPRRRDGLEGLAGPLREPGAARPGRVARPAQGRRRRQRLERRERVERALELDPGAAPVARARRGEKLFDLGWLFTAAALSSDASDFSFSMGKRRFDLVAVRLRGTVRRPDGRSKGGGTSRTVLVVDDERSLRLLCRVNLELDGHRVLEAATLAEARARDRAGDAGRDPARHPRRRRRRARAARRDRVARAVDARRAPVRDERGRPGAARPRRRGAREAVRARRSSRPPSPAPSSGRLGSRERRRRSERRPSTRSAWRATSSSARRRGAPSASARRRSPSRRRSSSATATSSRTAQVDVLRAAEEAADGDERERLYRLRKTCEAGIVSAELAGARGRAREPDPGRPGRLARRGAAAADRAGEARRAAGLRRPRRARLARERRQRPLQRRPPRAARGG